MKREIILGILCFITAASICVQYRSVHNYTTNGQASVQSMSENKLRDRVLKEKENNEKLNAQYDAAELQLEKVTKDSANKSDETKQLEEELSELNRLSGYTDVKGKGLIITLRDADPSEDDSSDSIIHDLDLIDVVNELFNAGAEAVSINDQRILSTTAINCNGNVVRINNEKIAVPFVIKAIGSPEGLYGTLTRPDGYLDLMKDYKIKIEFEKKEKNDLVVPKYTGKKQYEYLQIDE